MTNSRNLTWTDVAVRMLFAFGISWLLSSLLAYYRIYLLIDDAIHATALYWIVWIPALLFFVIFLASKPTGSKPPLLFFGSGGFLFLCLNLVFAGPYFGSFQTAACYLVSHSGPATRHNCICRTDSEEGGESYDDCAFDTSSSLPFVRYIELPQKQYGMVRPGFYDREEFHTLKSYLAQFSIEENKQLVIYNERNDPVGYIDFRFIESTNSFEVFFVADIECENYYETPLLIKNSDSVSIMMCGNEHNLRFTKEKDQISVDVLK